MDTKKYLQRIQVSSKDQASLEALSSLQRQHLLYIPFENLDIHLGKEIVLDYKVIYEKVVLKKRGGFCYELNGLFYFLLKELGYSVRMISARVKGNSGRIGEEFDHMAIIATIENQDWLVDVGFGKFSFTPLKIELNEVQGDGRDQYKISKYNENYLGVYVLGKSTKGQKAEDWQLGYLFTLDHREVSEFEAMCHYQQTSSETNFTKRRMITKPTLTGRVTLTDAKLKIVENRNSSEKEVSSEDDFQKSLSLYFKMQYNY